MQEFQISLMPLLGHVNAHSHRKRKGPKSFVFYHMKSLPCKKKIAFKNFVSHTLSRICNEGEQGGKVSLNLPLCTSITVNKLLFLLAAIFMYMVPSFC